jgi:hypothetical protein
VPEYLEGEISLAPRRAKQFDFSNDIRFKHRQRLRFNYKTVKNILTNPLLVGDIQYFSRNTNKETITIRDAYPGAAFLTRQEFNLLQAAIGRRNFTGTQKRNYPLSGLIFCAICGARCYTDCGGERGGKPRVLYYVCKNQKFGCHAKRIQGKVIEDDLIEKLTAKYVAISQLAQSSSLPSTPSPEIQQLETQVNQLLGMADNETIRKAIAQTRKEIEQLRQEKEFGSVVKEQNTELLRSIFANSLYWETLGNLEKQEIYRLLVKKILIGIESGKSYVERADLLV